jgi:hypothetical protein
VEKKNFDMKMNVFDDDDEFDESRMEEGERDREGGEGVWRRCTAEEEERRKKEQKASSPQPHSIQHTTRPVGKLSPMAIKSTKRRSEVR